MNYSDVELPSNRKFGFFFTAIFAAIGAYLFSGEAVTLTYVLFALATIFFVVTIVKADALLPLNKLWMKFGLLLGLIVSPIILGIIFFGLFTPIALCMKVFGRDELRLKLAKRTSYWKERNMDISQVDAFKHQY